MSMFSSITSFISSSISSLPFKLTGDGSELVHPSQSVAQGGGIWKHFAAMRVAPGMGGALSNAAGEPVSVFTFDKRVGNADQLHLARNALQRIKTLRHPNIIKYIDSVDLPTHLHILTEPVTPLILKPIALSNEMAQLTASLGLHQIVSTISWLNNEAKIVHSNLHPGSLYTTESGDWKLFGFDLSFKGTEPLPDPILIGRNSGILPVQYKAPELIKNASSNAPPAVLHATDAWSLACLIFHLFNSNFSSPQQLAQTGTIPPSLVGDYKKLLATNPANRLNPKILLDSVFFRNDLVSSVEFLDQLALKSAAEKDAFFVHFAQGITSETKYPKQFCKGKILPLLTKSLDYGSGLTTSFSAILSAVLKIGSSSLNEQEFSALVLPSVLKLFASNERQIRVHLLQHLGEFATFLTESLVNESIFTHILTGFSDSNAILRELTVKSLLHLAPKLNAANMDQALRMLAKLQTDPEPAIRTNTGYCIAKIASFLNPGLQEKVLFPAFSKCLRDPFPPARVAGLMSFLATLELHKPVDVARKILPTVAPCLVDDVREVREAALKLLEACTARMSAFHAHLRQQQEAAIAANPNAMGSHQQTTLSPNAAPAESGAAGLAGSAGAVLGSLGSWAASTVVSTVRSKISNADANPPAKSLQSGGSNGAPNAGSNLNSSSAAGRSYGNSSSTPSASAASSSSSILAAAAAGASPGAAASSSAFDNDDFFNDFSDRPGDNGEAPSDDSDDGMTPVAVTLSTKKPAAGAARKSSAAEPKEKKKSILSGGGGSKFAISPPPSAAAAPAASNSLDSWSFDMDDAPASSSASKQQSLVDDFDDWGSSVTSAASLCTKPAAKSSSSSLHAKKSSDSTDLLSFHSPPPAAAHKKTPSAASSASDPFAALSLSSGTGASPKPPSSSPGAGGGMALKPKASPLGAKPVVTSTTSAAKKAGGEVDFWSDF